MSRGFPSGNRDQKNDYSSGVTGGIAFAGFSGSAAGFSAGAGDGLVSACSGSTDPTASCGAATGRLRGTGGLPGVMAADFAAGFA